MDELGCVYSLSLSLDHASPELQLLLIIGFHVPHIVGFRVGEQLSDEFADARRSHDTVASAEVAMDGGRVCTVHRSSCYVGWCVVVDEESSVAKHAVERNTVAGVIVAAGHRRY